VALPRLSPQVFWAVDRIDFNIFPRFGFIAVAVELSMMGAAKQYRELIARF